MSVNARRAREVPLARPQAALAAALLGLAALAWASTERRMGSMSSAPGADLGTVGFYTGVWVTMMAAMMFPSIAPMVVVYDRLRSSRRARDPAAPGVEGSVLFVGGYLLTWTLAGLTAYAAIEAVAAIDGGVLAWQRAGHELAAGVVLASSAYQLTPIKDRCLARCRGPFGFVLEHWHEGHHGAVRMGMIHGAWCTGCCWALMAALFALGIMSVGWMAVIAALIAVEKLVPGKRAANRLVAFVLLALGLAILFAPDAVPGIGQAASEMGM